MISRSASTQNVLPAQNIQTSPFRVGERLTYNISFEKFNNAGYAELYVVSRGRLGEKNAVELRSKIKTTDLVSSAFYSIDQQRTTFASAETGLPLYIRKTSNTGILPQETISNYLVNPTVANDLLTFIYQARNAGGVGIFSFQEDEQTYSVNLQNTVGERVKTAAGDFDTSVSTVQSSFLTERGITDLRVNFGVDEARVPVLIRFKTAKGEFRVELASLQTLESAPAIEPTPTPLPVTPPQKTPKPIATPTPYIENQSLLPDLPFALGETLEYQVSMLGKYFGNVALQVKERRQFAGQDSLLLTATATGTERGNPLFNLNDAIRSQVNPDTLEPQQIELKFTGFFSPYNQTAQFDQKNGFVIFNGASRSAMPVGTHSLLSLAYAVRAFNLKPSKDPNNPVNDTRVAVFVGSQPYVFTLRPSTGDVINLKGEKVGAQLITITTGNPGIDSLGFRLWLSTDEKRLPLRLTVGNYQADLVSETNISPK
ncbi:MAG TPA: DUF3108 domain-containing protein [Pyrinomonadaceae bacterium]|nr:DUF3108 domain-containing protein [Pyrinomonadaceae bacterium]